MYSITFFERTILFLLGSFIFVLTGNGSAFSQSIDTSHLFRPPVYPPVTSDIATLKKSVAPLMAMSLKEVVAQVPQQSGIFFIGCPNCHSGAQEMNVLSWKPGMGPKVRCNYCGMVFPNDKFPENGEKVILAPGGERQVYRYYQDGHGYPYYFEAHAWYERWLWIRPMAEKLAQLWYVTGDQKYGDRAAAITGRFARVFPDYAIRYDYPGVPVEFFPADQKWPYKGLSSYRGAKWNWWGYLDMPTYLANAYDILLSGYDWKRLEGLPESYTPELIENNLLRLSYEYSKANPETYSNMSPGMYTQMIRLGRILGDPLMIQEALKRFKEFFPKGFFADGWWKEGTPSYHDQTINALGAVLNALEGYKNPAGWKDGSLEKKDLLSTLTVFGKALEVKKEAVLPNGRKIPMNDTWGFQFGEKTDTTISRLWPALGNAAVGAGKGNDQVMLNVNWSGNYGHSHDDNGSIILYAMGQELLSDIGYTHTKYRSWTTYTASHNTVVVDMKNQEPGTPQKNVKGRLKFYDDRDAHVKVVDVDVSPSYSMTESYRRRLIMVNAAPGIDYVVDVFDVKGGEVHDWFLHGMCEQEGSLETSMPLDHAVKTLVPEWGGNKLPASQKDQDWVGKSFHSYALLRDIKNGMAPGSWSATWRYDSSGLRSHILSQSGTEVFRFRSPSIRPAEEDNNKLGDFLRNGIMQRHTGGTSVFIAVHEPFRDKPWIKSVKREGENIWVRYLNNGSEIEDHISFKNNEVEVVSSSGWKYHSGAEVTGVVKALINADGKFTLQLDKKVAKTAFVRMDFPGGDTYYCRVEATRGNLLELRDDPGFTLEETGKLMRFHTFPGDQYRGVLRYTLFTSKKG